MNPRLHVLGLVHTETTRAFDWCAFTSKTRRFCTMMTSLGYDVRLYGTAANEAAVTEHIPLVTRAEQQAWFPAYDPQHQVFNEFRTEHPAWSTFNARAAAAIAERSSPGDVLCCTLGTTHKPVADALADRGLFAVESGIGYGVVWANYRVYESAAWRHHVGGREVNFFHDVIPNFFDPADFPLGDGDGAYYLFIGRFQRDKGVAIAVDATERLGAELVMAGQGVTVDGQTFRGSEVEVTGAHLRHVGLVGPAERARLMGRARAVFVPSQYLEPFGGVAVEAQLCGAPVITTDFGAFTETVEQGVSGFRCRMLSDFVAAGRQVRCLDRGAIRRRALALYSTDVVRHQYDAYFRRLQTRWGAGWYA